MRYREELDPYVHIGPALDEKPPVADFLGYEVRTRGSVDYVLVMATEPVAELEGKAAARIARQLDHGYDLIYTSPGHGFARLYRRRGRRRGRYGDAGGGPARPGPTGACARAAAEAARTRPPWLARIVPPERRGPVSPAPRPAVAAALDERDAVALQQRPDLVPPAQEDLVEPRRERPVALAGADRDRELEDQGPVGLVPVIGTTFSGTGERCAK